MSTNASASLYVERYSRLTEHRVSAAIDDIMELHTVLQLAVNQIAAMQAMREPTNFADAWLQRARTVLAKVK